MTGIERTVRLQVPALAQVQTVGHQGREQLWGSHSILLSQDDKPPPKGFEKFFKKNKDRKEAEANKGEEEQAEEKKQEGEKEELGKEETETSSKKTGEESKGESSTGGEMWKQFQNMVTPDPGNGGNNNNNYMMFAAFLALCTLGLINFKKPMPEILYSEFYNDYLIKNQVKEIAIKKDSGSKSTVFNHRAEITMNDGLKYQMILGSQESFLTKLDLIQKQMDKRPDEMVPVKYDNSEGGMENVIQNLLILGVISVFFWKIYKGKNPGSAGKMGKSGKKSGEGGNDWFGSGGRFGSMNKANVNTYGEDKKIDVRFKDVAGSEQAKLEVVEFVDFLKNPKKYQALGARVPRGALLVGPPGTGKTLLAKAVAGEAGVPFLSTSGSEFVEMFVGVGASRVRDLFKKAREKAPSIVFIDEIDAVGKKRNARAGGGGNEERDNTLNQLLVEMDGFATDSSVVVLAATNRADSLDSALLRPGRFDRQIEVILPTIKERESIFKVHLRSIKTDTKLAKTEYARKLAALTPGFSGADIMNICNEGAIIAARKNMTVVSIREFEQATERVIGGIERKLPQSENERRTVAYHEAGHAVAGWFSEYAAPLIKLTIIPRAKGSLGFAQYLPDELTLYTTEQLEDMIKVALGGRISEEIFFNRVTTGASDDFKKCAQIAHGMVTEYGLSPKLGTINYAIEESGQKKFSEATNQLIDEEINRIIRESYSSCRSILEEKKEVIERLAEELLAKETLSLPEIVEIMGPRPFPMKETLKEYLEELKDRQVHDKDAEDLEKEQEEKAKKDMAAQIKFDVDAEDDDKEDVVDEEKEDKAEAEEKTEDKKEEDKKEEDAAETPADKKKDEKKDEDK